MNAPALPAIKRRIESIDILRGLVMVIMALDHVRDVMHLGAPEPTDLATTTPILFFSRFITHFCAPTFVLLSGVSAFIAGTRRTRTELSNFLLKRGSWLIAVEILVINFGMTLDPGYHTMILQVIWAIGGSMVLLGLLIRLKASLAVIGAIGLLIFLCHDLLDIVDPCPVANTFVWKLLLSSAGFNSAVSFGGNHMVIIAYALLPWTGIMLMGYVLGSLYRTTVPVTKRKRVLLYAGLGLLLLFFVLRFFNLYGDPAPWSIQRNTSLSIISFFNVSKYPASLLYSSMTLGTALLVLALIENTKNRFARIMIVYGNVPFFYYVCHWYLIQFIHVILFFAFFGYNTKDIIMPGNPLFFSATGFGFNLGGVYLVWLIVIGLLYFPCRWFGNYKRTHHQWWLSYV